MIRFTNDEVLANLEGVVEGIAAACTLTRPRGPTSPLKGEGAPSPGPAGLGRAL